MNKDPGIVAALVSDPSTTLGLLLATIGLLYAVYVARKASKDLDNVAEKLLSETRAHRELTRFMIRGLVKMGIADPVTDDDGFPTGYRIKDGLGSEAIYESDQSGSSVFRITTRVGPATPEWELSGLSNEALDLLTWMSHRFLAVDQGTNAAEFVYEGFEDVQQAQIVTHLATGESYRAALDLISELYDENYVEIPDGMALGRAGTFYLSMEPTKNIFPWMRS